MFKMWGDRLIVTTTASIQLIHPTQCVWPHSFKMRLCV